MKKKLPFFLAAVLLVAVDQVTKVLTRALIPLGAKITLIPGVVGLTYLQNTGAAFSSFSGGTVLLAAVSLVMTVLLAVILCKNVFFRHPFPQWCLAVIMAGACGNLIDRALLGMVTDMIDTLFMNFAVYNFADICVTLGAIALAVYVVFFYDRYEGKKAKKESGDAADPDR